MTRSKSLVSSGDSRSRVMAPMPSSPPRPPSWASLLWHDTQSRHLHRHVAPPSREALLAAIREAEWWLTSCPRPRLLELLSRLRLHCPMRDMAEAEARLLLEDYLTDLAEVPVDIIEAECIRWRRSQKWFPSIAELLAACEPDWSRRRRYLHRLEQVRDAPPEPEPPPPDPEREARLQREIDAMLARMRGRPEGEEEGEAATHGTETA